MSYRFLLSPTENDLSEALGSLGITSSIPESKGCDILIYSSKGVCGVQRKKVPHDFLSSFTDGRLARSLPLMKDSCAFCRILAEEHFRYYPDGSVDLGYTHERKRIKSRFTKTSIKAMVNDIQFIHGITIDWTDNLGDTVLYLKCLAKFLDSDVHIGLFHRPNVKGLWTVPSSREIELWLLQSFPGIGPATADKIIQHFGGKTPLNWTCSLDELMKVPGLSKAKALEVYKILAGDNIPAQVTTSVAQDNEQHKPVSFDSLRAKLFSRR